MSTDATTSPSEAPGERAAAAVEPADAVAPEHGGELVSVLGPDGVVVNPARDPLLSDEEVVRLYEALVRARAFDEAATRQAAEGHIAFHASSRTDVAAVVGSAFALREGDWVFPSHREVGAALERGLSAQAYADQLFGNADDIARGRQLPDHLSCRGARIASASSPSGTQITHAVGFAWAAKLAGDPLVVLVYFSDGASASGDFHNGMNFAGVFKTPAVFFCRTGGGGENAPRAFDAGETVADKGIAYAVPAVRCDGLDVLAVLSVTREALARAARGEGATLVEAVTRRAGRGGEGELGAIDPVARMGKYVDARLRWGLSRHEELRSRVRAEAEHALAVAAAKPRPALATMFEDVFSEVPARLDDQRREAEACPRRPERG